MVKNIIVSCAILLLVACGGASNDTPSSPNPPPTPQPPPTPTITQAEAAHFLNQATFGATIDEVNKLVDIGYEQWLNQQIATPTSSHVTYLTQLEAQLNLPDDEQLWHPHRMEAWFTHAITAPDQLRQRVAFALSEIFVISELSVLSSETYGLANYYDLLLNNAFANYRDLLAQVTLSPMMGAYLSMLGNQKPNEAQNIRPDENYAREVMQLFSIGLVELNIDGTIKTSNGQAIPTYDQNIIKAFAHVFTGWNFNGATEATWYNFAQNYDAINPMSAVDAFHDKSEKVLLNGVTVPANQSAEQDLAIALDNLFNHPNVGPFIGKQLIQRLVTSNPSPDYIERVAQVFNDNGQGVRGDLGAVIKAILLDDEARNGYKNNPQNFGKIREPLVSIVHLWRAFDASSPNDRFQFDWPHYFFNQAPLAAPHVFNFFSPSYSPPGIIRNNNLVAPELEIMTENYLTRTNNFFAYSTLWGHLEADPEDISDDRILINLNSLRPMANNSEDLLNYLNRLIFGGTLDDNSLAILKTAYQQTLDNDIPENERLSNLLFLIFASPQYSVQQ